VDPENQDRTAGAQTGSESPEAWGWTRSRSQVNDFPPPGRGSKGRPLWRAVGQFVPKEVTTSFSALRSRSSSPQTKTVGRPSGFPVVLHLHRWATRDQRLDGRTRLGSG